MMYALYFAIGVAVGVVGTFYAFARRFFK